MAGEVSIIGAGIGRASSLCDRRGLESDLRDVLDGSSGCAELIRSGAALTFRPGRRD